jgi:hypothetical protein
MGQKVTYVWDADLDKCVARLAPDARLAQRAPRADRRRQRRAGRTAGGLAPGPRVPTTTGTMPGRPLSPLLATVALYGRATAITPAFLPRGRQHGPPPPGGVSADAVGMLH